MQWQCYSIDIETITESRKELYTCITITRDTILPCQARRVSSGYARMLQATTARNRVQQPISTKPSRTNKELLQWEPHRLSALSGVHTNPPKLLQVPFAKCRPVTCCAILRLLGFSLSPSPSRVQLVFLITNVICSLRPQQGKARVCLRLGWQQSRCLDSNGDDLTMNLGPRSRVAWYQCHTLTAPTTR